MSVHSLFLKVMRKYQIFGARYLYRNIISVNLSKPIISFSFDDAPKTAFTTGGVILNTYGVNATYYTSLGLLGKDSPSGLIANLDDLRYAVEKGHELGCHSFHHFNPRETKTTIFEESVLENSRALARIFPDFSFKTLAYPINGPRPLTKKRIGRLFLCCRVGGQIFNVRKVDLNYVKSFFLDSRTGVTIEQVKSLIDKNVEYKGWLIFATHDVQEDPSQYGCTPEFFKEVVKYATSSGAVIMPVGKACEYIQGKITK